MKFVTYCRSCSSRDVVYNDAILSPFVTHKMFNIKPVKTDYLYGQLTNNKVNYMPCYSSKCNSCNFLGINIVFDDEEMSNLYRGYRGDEYDSIRRLYEPSYSSNMFCTKHEYVKEVEKLLSNHCKDVTSLIDFGGGDGINTPVLSNVDTYVFDISDIKCLHTKIDKLFKCDLITCMQVLEHVSDPNEICKSLRTFSRYYYFEVPNEDTSKLKEMWHEHINFFNTTSFKNLLSRHFEILHVETNNLHIRAICKEKGS